jgi:cyanophycin synthetase
MGTSYVDVGAVMNVTNDHIGMDGIETLDDLAFVKGTVVKIARGTAVLGADDPRVLAMKEGCRRVDHVCLVSMGAVAGARAVREHVAWGGRACILEDETLVLYHDGVREEIVAARHIPATLDAVVRHNVENALFAAAMSWSAGLSLGDLQRGLASFRMSYEATPGRMNVHDENPFRVIMDYGHNPAGYRAMGETVERLGVHGRCIAVFGTRATRRDDEVRECARVVAKHFDLFVCRGEDGYYGRPLDEVPRIQADELERCGVPPDCIHAIASEVEAVDAALSLARPGDVVVVFAANLGRTWDQIRAFVPDAPAEASRERASRDSLPHA